VHHANADPQLDLPQLSQDVYFGCEDRWRLELEDRNFDECIGADRRLSRVMRILGLGNAVF